MLFDILIRLSRAAIRGGKYPSRLVLDVANYVKHHLSEAINTEQMAKKLFISRPYLFQKFKEEMGETLTDFILKEKTEEAKRLLRYTDRHRRNIGRNLNKEYNPDYSICFPRKEDAQEATLSSASPIFFFASFVNKMTLPITSPSLMTGLMT